MKFSKVLIAVLACTSLLLTQEAAAAPKTAKKAASISGVFVSGDAVANTLIVKVGKKDDTLAIDAGAKVISGKDTIQLGAIPADSKLTIKTKIVDGKQVASEICVKAAAAPKAEKTKKVVKKTEESTTTTEPAAK
jgi:hypothetical protein